MTYLVWNFTRNIFDPYNFFSRPHRLRDICKKSRQKYVKKGQNLHLYLFEWIFKLIGRPRRTREWPILEVILRGKFSVSTMFSLGFIDCEIFAKKSPKMWEKSKISIFTYLNWWICRLKRRSRLTLEWPTLYEIQRGIFSVPIMFPLGLIDREIFPKNFAKNVKKGKNFDL